MMRFSLEMKKIIRKKFCFVVLLAFVFLPLSSLAQPDNGYEVYQQPGAAVVDMPGMDYREKLLQLFSFVDEFEKTFKEMKYLNIFGRLPEVKIKFEKAAKIVRQFESSFTPEQKILAKLYGAKYNLFVGMGSVMKNLRIDSGFRAAILRSGFVVLTLYNQIIDKFRTPRNFSKEDLDQLNWHVANISRRTQKYSIRAKYLQLDGNKIPTGEKVMVLQIKDKRALVLYMGPTMNNQQIEGWVSLRDLKKRTTWKKENSFFFQ